MRILTILACLTLLSAPLAAHAGERDELAARLAQLRAG